MAEVTLHFLPGTPEEIERNRRALEHVLEQIESRKAGRPVEVKLLDTRR